MDFIVAIGTMVTIVENTTEQELRDYICQNTEQAYMTSTTENEKAKLRMVRDMQRSGAVYYTEATPGLKQRFMDGTTLVRLGDGRLAVPDSWKKISFVDRLGEM